MTDRYIVELVGTKKSYFRIGAALAVLSTRLIAGTAGEIDGGGDLSGDLTLSLADSGVTPGVYGDAVTVPEITVDSKGRISLAVGRTITPAGIGAALASHTHAWSSITGTPTTLAGYGITDAVGSGDSRLADSRAPTGSAGGDLGSTYPNPTVVGIRGASVPVLSDGWLRSLSGVLSWDTPTASDVGADAAGTADAAIADHVAAVNPHPQYLLASDTVDWSLIVNAPTTVLGYGITDAVDTSDARLSDARTPTGAAGGHLTGTYPNPSIAGGVIVNSMIDAAAAIAWSKLSFSGALPSDIGAAAISHTQAWSTITATPTTVSGYGITDAALNTVTITGAKSISGGGSLAANRTLELVNDATTPGNSQYYGTDGSGTKGWFSLPAVSGMAPDSAEYVLITADAGLASARTLAAGVGLTLTDAGAGSTVTFAVSFGTSASTACVGNDSRLSDARTPSGAASGDLSGTYPAPTILGSAIVTRLNAMSTADLKVSAIRLVDGTDVTKKFAVDLSGLTTLTTRTWALPDRSDTFAGLGAQSFTGLQTFTGGLTVTTADVTITDRNVVLSATTGTKWGTATTQKQAWWNATPIVRPTGDVITALGNLGLIGSPTISATTLTGVVPAANGGTGVNNAGTLTNASDTTITGGGTLALAGFTLTVPATGTAALLTTANVFSASQTVNRTASGVINVLSLRNLDAGTTSAAQFRIGNDASAAVGYFFATSSSYTGGFAGASSMNFGSSGAVGLLSADVLRLIIDTSGNFGFNTATTAGNGVLQLASGTTKANGVAFGTDTFLYRTAAGVLAIAGTSFALSVPTIAANDTIATLGLSQTFTAAQTIDLGTGALPAVVQPVVQRMSSADTVTLAIEQLSWGANCGNYNFRLHGGTRATPAATPNGGVFLNFAATGGHDGSAYTTTTQGNWRVLADGVWSGSNRGVLHAWRGTAGGSTTASEWMRLQMGASDPSGVLILGGGALTTGNGLLQLASGTAKAYGVAFGADGTLFRAQAGGIRYDGNFLDVYSSANAYNSIACYNTNAGASAGSEFILGNNTSNTAFGFFVNSSANAGFGGASSANFVLTLNAPMTFWTNNIQRMQVTAAGSLSISTATASISTATGSLINAGGFGNAGSIYCGGSLIVTGTTSCNFFQTSGGTYSGNIFFAYLDQYPTITWRSGTTNKFQFFGDVANGDGYFDCSTGRSIAFRDGIGGGGGSIASFALAGSTLYSQLTISDAKDLVFGSTSGSKIGTANTQKLGFWGTTPIAQKTGYGTPTGNVQTTNFPGATATLLQTAQELAQLLLDLKAAGIIGA